jgi:hypothetical protein
MSCARTTPSSTRSAPGRPASHHCGVTRSRSGFLPMKACERRSGRLRASRRSAGVVIRTLSDESRLDAVSGDVVSGWFGHRFSRSGGLRLIPRPVPHRSAARRVAADGHMPRAARPAMRGHRRARARGPDWQGSQPWFEPWHQERHRRSEDYARKPAEREERSLAGGVHAAGRTSSLRRCSEGQP